MADIVDLLLYGLGIQQLRTTSSYSFAYHSVHH